MITKIRPLKNSFEEGIFLFKEISPKKINILFGGNGVGKSTLLKGIERKTLTCESDKEFRVISYTNSKHNFKYAEPSVCDMDYSLKILKKINTTVMSEGQSIIYSICSFLNDVYDLAIKNENKTIVVLMDEIDSGLSSENINMIIHFISILNKKVGNLQFFISSNAYHFVHVFKQVLSMYNGRFIKIDSYEDFYKILSSNMIKLGQHSELKFLQGLNFLDLEEED